MTEPTTADDGRSTRGRRRGWPSCRPPASAATSGSASSGRRGSRADAISSTKPRSPACADPAPARRPRAQHRRRRGRAPPARRDRGAQRERRRGDPRRPRRPEMAFNMNKLTEKAQEAIVAAQRLAEERHHTQLEPEHLLSRAGRSGGRRRAGGPRAARRPASAVLRGARAAPRRLRARLRRRRRSQVSTASAASSRPRQRRPSGSRTSTSRPSTSCSPWPTTRERRGRPDSCGGSASPATGSTRRSRRSAAASA